MSNSAYKCTDKQLVSGLLAMIVVITTIFVMFDKHILPMFVDSLTTTKSPAVTNTTNKVTYNIHHLYQLPDGRKISVGYYNTNTYVSIPATGPETNRPLPRRTSNTAPTAAPSRGTFSAAKKIRRSLSPIPG